MSMPSSDLRVTSGRLMTPLPMNKMNYTSPSGLTLALDQGPIYSRDSTQSADSEQLLHKDHSNMQMAMNMANMQMQMKDADEYESKSSSDINPDANSAGEDQVDQDLHHRPNKKRYHRHSQHQIQEMERVFKECPHPDEKQRLELSRELKLDPRQVKFWFQNKRTQVKAQHERHDNAFLRSENEKLRTENLALRDAIANVACPNCGGPASLADVSFDEQQLRIENVRLREEIDRISTIAAKHIGRPISTFTGSTLSPSPAQSSLINNSTATTNSLLPLPTYNNTNNAAYNGSSAEMELLAASNSSHQSGLHTLSEHHTNGNINVMSRPLGLPESEKPVVAELATVAMEELVQIAQAASEPLWVLDPNTGMEVMDPDQYLHRFPSSPLMVSYSASHSHRTESSRHTGLVMMNSASLVEALMDVNRWTDMFSSIVCRALPVEVLSHGVGGSPDGAMQLMYAEFQMPSPMVSTRESYFVRYCKRMVNRQLWVVVDVSVDSLMRSNPPPSALPRCKRRPSGCIIEDAPTSSYSKVTWVEHFEILEDARGGLQQRSALYENLLRSGLPFGAQRWMATLRHHCERNSALLAPHDDIATSRDLVTPTWEGRKSLLKLAERMTNNFCGGVSASIAHTWITLSPGSGSSSTTTRSSSSSAAISSSGASAPVIMPTSNGSGGGGASEDVRVLIRKSVDDPGRPPGIVLCAATSIWLPLPPSRVFAFLKDERFRNEWDILSNMGVVEEIVHLGFKGQDPTNNHVSLLRVNVVSSNQPNMLILQECISDETCSMVVYAPVDVAAMSAVLNGGDPDCVALLPSGFSILPDKPQYHHHHHHLHPNNGATNAQLGSMPNSPGSLLTVAFQILVDHVPTAKLSLGSVATVNNLISSTVLRIKSALLSTPSTAM